MSAKGRFITFEGGEGAGKTTQIARLAQALTAAGLEVVRTREPGGTPGAETIRELLVTGEDDRWDAEIELLLITAARRDHVRNLIEPNLAAGKWILCDRFLDSTRAYQGYGRGLGEEIVLSLHREFIGDLHPDLTIILDLPADEGLQRAGHREAGGDKSLGETRFETAGRDFHRKLRNGFLAIAQAEPDRCVVIDSRQDVEEVSRAIRAAVATRLKVDFGS